jgi:hypothetical protein
MNYNSFHNFPMSMEYNTRDISNYRYNTDGQEYYVGGVIYHSVADILSFNDYYPGGMIISQRSSAIEQACRYGFNGMEKTDEISGAGNHYTAEFWEYDPTIIRRWNTDPVVKEWESPYATFRGNPIWYSDPNGDDPSTDVTKNKDGTFTVVGGDANDGDKGVYVVGEGGARTGEKVGESLSTHSFADAKDNIVTGAVINPSSTEGQDFINNDIVDGDPSLVGYMWNARNGEDYDIKDLGIENRGSLSRQQYRYRGSVSENGKFGSARDFGNIGAGIVAARKGLSWEAARKGFDTYQGKSEPTTTQNAQRLGYQIGLQLRKSEEIIRVNNQKNNPGVFKYYKPKI